MAETLEIAISNNEMTKLKAKAKEQNISIDELFNTALSKYLDDLEGSDTLMPVVADAPPPKRIF